MKKIYSLLVMICTMFAFAQTYTADFEAESKGSYSAADLDIGSPAINWNISDALIGNQTNDWFNGTKSLRMRGYANTAATMNVNKTGGIGQISFSYKQYGSDSQIPYNVDWSSDGVAWTTIGTITADATVQTFSYALNQSNARIRIVAVGGGTSNKRMNIDDIVLTDNGSAPVPVLAVSPNSLDFGSVNNNATSSAQTITVSGSNLTAAPTYTVTGTDAAMFAVTGNLTTTGGTLSVTFTPTSLGAKTATVEVTSGSLTKTVSLMGNSVDPNNPYGLDASSPLSSLSEDFETGVANTSFTQNNWTVGNAQVADRTWDTKEYNMNKYAQMSAYNGNGVYQTLLISPAVNLDAINKSAVTFDMKTAYTNGAELKIYILKLVNGVMQSTLVQTINDNSNPTGFGNSFVTQNLDLSAYNGVAFLAFEYNGDSSTNNTSNTTLYQIDNVAMPAITAGVNDVTALNTQFVKNTIVNDAIYFNNSADVKVFNMNGQVVKAVEVSEYKPMDTSDLLPGMYIVTGIVDGEAVSQKVLKK